MSLANIFGLDRSRLEEFVLSLGEPKYRAGQLYQWLYAHRARTFGEMTNLPQPLRDKLAGSAVIGQLGVAASQSSAADGTRKFLFELSDGRRIESVLIPPRPTAADADERMTLCVSTQVGCALDCSFCATATMGFIRNLSPGEIVGQLFAAEAVSGRTVTNIVFMGMGEPMLNYDNVMTAVELLTDQTGIGISPKRITLSTAGYADRIRRMADEDRKIKLALSLHSLRGDVRTALMPITKKFSPDELLQALEYYQKRTRKSVMLEYIVFDGVNDTDEDVRLLVKASRRIECRVNLIPFHSIDFTGAGGRTASLRGAPPEGIDAFWKKLRSHGVTVFIRNSAGVDIDAACGQLAVRTTQ